MEEWFKEAFGADYTKIYGHRTQEEADRQAEFLISALQLGPRSRVHDITCGPGRHLLALHQRGIRAWGGDLSPALLTEAHHALPHLRLVRHDMRRLPYREGAASHVLSLFTSFGYFQDERENMQVLREVYRITERGGTCVIDHINQARLLSTLVPTSERQIPGGFVRERRTWVAASRRVEKEIEIIEGTSTRRYRESVRVYTQAEISDLLRHAGFRVTGVKGGFNDSAFTGESERMLVFAERL